MQGQVPEFLSLRASSWDCSLARENESGVVSNVVLVCKSFQCPLKQEGRLVPSDSKRFFHFRLLARVATQASSSCSAAALHQQEIAQRHSLEAMLLPLGQRQPHSPASVSLSSLPRADEPALSCPQSSSALLGRHPACRFVSRCIGVAVATKALCNWILAGESASMHNQDWLLSRESRATPAQERHRVPRSQTRVHSPAVADGAKLEVNCVERHTRTGTQHVRVSSEENHQSPGGSSRACAASSPPPSDFVRNAS